MVRQDPSFAYLRDVIAVAGNNAGHQVVVPAQIFRGAVVDYVCAVLQGPLQVGAHHGVVDDHDRLLALLLHKRTDALNIYNFEERVGGRLQEHHGGLPWLEDRDDRLRLGRVDMVDDHAHVRAEVSQEAVRAAVEIISSNDFGARLEQACNNVERGHAARHREGMRSRRDLGDVVFCREHSVQIHYVLLHVAPVIFESAHQNDSGHHTEQQNMRLLREIQESITHDE